MAHSHSVSGKRVSRSHTTATGLAVRIVRMLEQSGLITKVALRLINPKGGSFRKRLIILCEGHGLHVRALEPSVSQELYVSAPDRDALIVYLEHWCSENGLDCTVRR